MRKRAFTLIELLVVIAIIAILAAILFPVFAKARERAMLTTCINNAKQLGTAFQMYTQDTDGIMPRWADSVPPPDPIIQAVNPNNTTWDVYLMPLVKAKASFTCPSNKTKEARQYINSERPVRSWALPRNISGMPISRMPAPAKTVLLFEKGVARLGIGIDATGERFGQTANGAQDLRFTEADPNKWGMFHRDGKVFLFVDGHAQWHKAILNTSMDNPFGYAFGPFPGDVGQYKIGYCGDKDTAGVTGASLQLKYGANLPR